VPPALNPLKRLRSRRSKTSKSGRLYGAIVAQARLPVFYRDLGVPDSLEGRFVVLSLHLFALLHRLKREGPAGVALAQELTDCFGRDMETVLREVGVGDLRVPKKMRALAGSAQALLEVYDQAIAAGEAPLAAAIAASLPLQSDAATVTGGALASYVMACASELDREPLSAFEAGVLNFPEVDKPQR
jgi:cytochrome b pre-mRNA-processing protein 3